MMISIVDDHADRFGLCGTFYMVYSENYAGERFSFATILSEYGQIG